MGHRRHAGRLVDRVFLSERDTAMIFAMMAVRPHARRPPLTYESTNRLTLARRVLGLAFALVAVGCASPTIKVGVQTRSQLHQPFADPVEILTDSPPRCAILPAAVSSTSAGFGPFTDQSLGRMLDDAVERGGQGILFLRSPTSHAGDDHASPTVLSPADVVNAANPAGLGGDLKALLASVSPGGVLDRDKLRRIGRLLDVEYLLLPWLVGVHTDNATRFNFAGITLVRTGWTTVEMVMQIWHAPSGRLVWQSTASGTLVGEGVVGNPPPIQPVLDAILRAMLEDFVSGRSETVLTTEIEPPAPPAAPASASSEASTPAATSEAPSPEANTRP